MDRVLTLELVRVTERAAHRRRFGARPRRRAARDEAAVEAMWGELNRLDIRGRIVVGVGERDAAPKLYVGEEVGTGDGPEVDIALDPLDGQTLCAKNMPNSLAGDRRHPARRPAQCA